MPNFNDLTMEYQGGNLTISHTNIDSLVGCPNHITGQFNCQRNELTSLVGGPQKVDSDYDCNHNPLTSLVGAPNIISGDFCTWHSELPNLVGSPSIILGDYFCTRNKITSLVGLHKIIKQCYGFYFDTEKIIEGGIGLLLISELVDISNSTEPFKIIRKYLGAGTKGMMECSKELTAKGYAPYAKL